VPDQSPSCLKITRQLDMKTLVLGLIGFYKAALSPMTIGVCKYYPTCSQYAAEAVDRHGVWRGLGMAMRRLIRCRPFRSGGYDPVR
jgi:putative membrane protein insertion efficiency factor